MLNYKKNSDSSKCCKCWEIKRTRRECCYRTSSFGSYLKRPILRRWENISPPGTYSKTMYKLELSWKLNWRQKQWITKSGKWQRFNKKQIWRRILGFPHDAKQNRQKLIFFYKKMCIVIIKCSCQSVVHGKILFCS